MDSMPFNTRLLDESIAKRRQQNEQTRQETLKRLLAWLDDRGSQYGIDRVYIFGSVTAPGRFRADSDIDLAIEQMAPEAFFAMMGQLAEAFERDVDLVELRKCHFADRIRAKGVVWNNPSLQS
ncbi:signal peptidase [filamentous cyanobacterium CCP1]|nr:signal peptidase [filamentous cyanobacterium CCP2]PSB65933.1 signal peptidase [filamentous cyanobacterium CCP1]